MVFSSSIFLFFFLPVSLLCYLLAGRWLRNVTLLAASLFFYTWGENVYVLLMLASIICNYFFGIFIDRSRKRGRRGWWFLIFAIVVNLGMLAFFKYANFVVNNLNEILLCFSLTPFTPVNIHLPIGISFFTFQALSYVIDVYRGQVNAQKSIIGIALYISLFPQLIAGPIVRYCDIADQIKGRQTTFDDFFYGVQRFILGLGKKVLIANVLGRTADYIFSLPTDVLPLSLAWLGAVSYTLQIYYDFSGYSDMAIGLGRMFGFRFLENFNYPYISTSIRDFWRRWHISLSSWFRDYLYIPLGGNQKGSQRTYLHLLTVFFLCGLWHGASWTFVVWGLFHGCFLIVERFSLVQKVLRVMPNPLQHLYVLVIVIIGWVFFRAETLEHAMGYLRAMITISTPQLFNSQIFININNEFYFVFIVAVLFSVPIYPWLQGMTFFKEGQKSNGCGTAFFTVVNLSFLSFIFFYSISSILRGSYNPFLYFRF